MPPFLSATIKYVASLPPAAKFFFILASTIVEYVFPVFPGDTIVLAAGFLANEGAVDLFGVIIAIAIGSVIGAWLTFAFGSYLSRKQNKFKWIKKPVWAKRRLLFDSWYQKWGYLFILISRFLPGIRSGFFVAAGFGGLSLKKVLALGTVSAFTFNACLLFAGHALSDNVYIIIAFWQQYSIISASVMATLIVFLLFWWLRKSKTFK